MFVSMFLIFNVRAFEKNAEAEGAEIIGIMVFAVAGIILGFIAGADKDPPPRSRRAGYDFRRSRLR